MMASLQNSALQICSIFFISFPLLVYGATGPSDVTVQQGDTATLTCSLGAPLGGFAAWSEDGVGAFADINGILSFAADKYSNFAIVKDDIANGQYDLRVDGAEYEDRGVYSCQVTGTAEPSATLTVEAEVTSVTITVDGALASPGARVTMVENTEKELVCTAFAGRPQVAIDWINKDTNDVEVSIPGDTETVRTNADNMDTQDTISTLQFTPAKSDYDHQLICKTSGQQAAASQSQFIRLNVHYKPDVTVTYTDKKISCTADANPLATLYEIILNGTVVLETFTTGGRTVDFVPDFCTTISCNATNTIDEVTGTFNNNEQVCPGYVEPTTPAPPNPSEPTPEPTVGLDAGIIAAIAIGCLIVVALVIGGIVYCYTQKKFCFDSNKTSNGGSSPKKQPSVNNADMIRNQPEVRQSVHNYDDEPKKPRVPRSNAGKPAPEKEALKQSAPPTDNDHQGYPMDSYDGDPQEGRGQAGVNYADLQFQNRDRPTNGHGKIHQSDEEPTQYASILV